MRGKQTFVVLFGVLLALAMLVPVSAGAAAVAKPKLLTVKSVTDGDTLRLGNNQRVRLVQIDAPETSSECYGNEAKNMLASILPPGTKVKLQADPALDKVDRYGRLLRYVVKGSLNVNIALASRGAATVWFFDGDRGRHATKLLSEAGKAQQAARGLWGACPGTPFDPENAADTGASTLPPAAACSDGVDNDSDGKTDYPADPGCLSVGDTSESDPAATQCADGLDNDSDGKTDYPADTGCSSSADSNETTSAYQCDDGLDNDGDTKIDYADDTGCVSPTDTTEAASSPPPPNCNSAYPTVCIPPPPPDLDCGDIAYTNFTVLAPDPHRFDGDRDGRGCES